MGLVALTDSNWSYPMGLEGEDWAGQGAGSELHPVLTGEPPVTEQGRRDRGGRVLPAKTSACSMARRKSSCGGCQGRAPPRTQPGLPRCWVPVCVLHRQCRQLAIRQGEQMNSFSIKTLTKGHTDANGGRPDFFLSQPSTSAGPRRCKEGARATLVSYKFCS